MKILKTISLALTLAGALTACGGSNQNTLPPMGVYPGQLTNPYNNQAPNLPGTNGDPLNNNVLPGDVTRGQVGSIVGRIVTRSGRPLHNVIVTLEGNPSIRAVSQQGDFTLMNVPVGQHSLLLKFGNLETTVGVNVVANMAVAPAQNPIQLDGEVGSEALAFANPNRQTSSFKVDQDLLNQWQARGIDVQGGTVYVSAIDIRNITRKGTVIKMNTLGEEWKDLAKTWLGLKHPLNSSARGIAATQSGVLLVADEKSSLFSVDSGTGKVEKIEADSALDIASGGSTVWITSVRGLEKSDASGSSRTLISGVAASGGVGADAEGNAYVCVSNTIVKVSAAGKATPLVKQYLNSPTDVATDSRNGDVYVLDGGEIKRFDKNGVFIVSFGSAALDPSAIDLDEEGNLYIADFGRDHKSSQILKFEAVPLMPQNAAAATSLAGSDSVSDTPAEEASEEELETGEELEELEL